MAKLAVLICVDEPGVPKGGSAPADASAFARILKKCWNFKDSEIVTLSSQSAYGFLPTRTNIERQFDLALQGDPLDSLIVGFWGRGYVSEDGKRRFCLEGFSADNAKNASVSLGSMLSATIRLRARDACFIVDCRPITVDGAPTSVESEDVRILQKYIRRTEPGYRFAVLSAASPNERPSDLIEGERGLFTSNLIDGLFSYAKRYQGSFDSVAGHAVQFTNRKAQELGRAQFPFFANEGDGDVRFEITPGFNPEESFDAYSPESASVPPAIPRKSRQDSARESESVELESTETVALESEAPSRIAKLGFKRAPSEPRSQAPRRELRIRLDSEFLWKVAMVAGIVVLLAISVASWSLRR